MEVKIGFEIHVQLNTKQKLFCKCSTDYRDKEPNTNICPICTGQPGSKPLPPNLEAIKNVIKVGLILGCKPNYKKVYFLRKHYFYPDLPKNYQITSEPLMVNGNFFGVRIREVHLEEDPGRYDLRNGYVDFNRSGVPLAEIVTEPDIKSPEQAKEWLEKLFLYLKYSKAIKDDPGSIRVDVNISIEGGERVEIKNVNSIEGVYYALKYEILRQKRLIESSEKVKRETRHYDEEKKITLPLREKETVADYRYMPDPDLIPIEITEELVNEVKKEIITPKDIENRLKSLGLKETYVERLLPDPEFALLSIGILNRTNLEKNYVAEIIVSRLRKVQYDLKLDSSKLKTKLNIDWFLELVKKVKNFEIPEKYFNEILRVMLKENKNPIEYAKEKGYIVISDINLIERTVEEVLKEERKALEEYLQGNKKVYNYLFGRIMRKLKGKANPKVVMEILNKKLIES